VFKILCNVKTQNWISLLFPTKCILAKHKCFVMHMVDEQTFDTTTKGNKNAIGVI
jgi:hypothetical protein